MFDSPWHWIVLAVVVLVLFFGWKQLPDMSRALGRSLRIFKTEIKGMTQDDQVRKDAEAASPKELNAPPVPPASGQPAAQPSAELPRAEVVRNRPRPTPGGNRPGVQVPESNRPVGQ
jgi:sec-independent protein translocase protein TatA